MTDFLQAAFPWIALGLGLAVAMVASAQRTVEKKPEDKDKAKTH